MNNTTRSRKKKKITYTATPEGIKRAELALSRLGFGSKSNFAISILVSRSTVTKFFGGKPVQSNYFQHICQKLLLSDWKEIAGIKKEEKEERLEISYSGISNLNEQAEQAQTPCRQVSVIDRQSGSIKLDMVLRGDINSVQNLKIIESILRENSGDTIQIIDIREG